MDKDESYRDLLVKLGHVEKEIEVFEVKNRQLQQEYEELKSRVTQDDMEERYVRLKDERDVAFRNLQLLRDDVSKKALQLAQGSCWKQKSEAIELSRDAIKEEHDMLKRVLDNVENAYEDQKLMNAKYQDRIDRIEAWKSRNGQAERAIDEMRQKILSLKAVSEIYKQIDKEEKDIKATYTKLEKKKLKLERALQKLKRSEVEIKTVTSESSELRRENRSLYEQIVALQDKIAQKGRLKARLKTLKSEEKSLLRRHGDLKKDLSALEAADETGRVDEFAVAIKRQENRMQTLRERNDELRSRHERWYVAKLAGGASTRLRNDLGRNEAKDTELDMERLERFHACGDMNHT